MSRERRLGIGIVGAGNAAIPHAMALADLHSEIEVRGVAGRDPEKLAAFAGRFGFPVAPNLETLLADPALDALLIVTPPDGAGIERAGHTLTVLKKVAGRWVIARDANLLAPVKPG